MKNNLLSVLGTSMILGAVGLGVLGTSGCVENLRLTTYEQKCAAVEERLDSADRTGDDYSLEVVSQAGVSF